MSEITLQLDDALADKLLIFAEKNQTSIEEMAKNYFSSLVSDDTPRQYSDVEVAQIVEINKRIAACESGEMLTISYDELKEDMQAFVKNFKAKNASEAL